MRRWKLKPKYKGKTVTVAVTGAEAGQPDVARIQSQMNDRSIIEGEHWAKLAGRDGFLVEVKDAEMQSIARAQRELAAKMGLVIPEPEPEPEPEPMVQPVEAASEPEEAPVEEAPIVAPVEEEAPVEPVRAREEDGTFRADDPATPDVNEAFEPPVPTKAESSMSRDDLEAMAYERSVTGPEGEDPSDAPNKATLVAWINGEDPPKKKRRRRK